MVRLAGMLWAIAGTVFAGIAIMTVLAVPSLSGHAMSYIPLAAIGGVVAALPVAIVVAWQINKPATR